MISGARLCALPHGYCWVLVTGYIKSFDISIPEMRPTVGPS
jgi:hypothetical protein